MSSPLRRRWYDAFLHMLTETANVSSAAKHAGVARSVTYAARAADPHFAAKWDEALETGVDALEAEARRRALEGTLKPIFQGGREVGEVREFSDALLMFLLRGHRPERYRERSEAWTFDPSQLSDEQLARIAKGEHPASVLADGRAAARRGEVH